MRLKQALGFTEDRQVADFLGMSAAALSERKRRNSFPEERLFTVASQRPEVKLDVPFVLTGAVQPAHASESASALGRLVAAEPDEKLAAFASELMHKRAERNALRRPVYDHLTDLAEHCDDAHLSLLVRVAESFRKASAQR